jgi:ubiquitin C-terminal hydrolase
LLDRLHAELTGSNSPKALIETSSIITDLFQGKLVSQVRFLRRQCVKCVKKVKCSVCGFTSRKIDPFLDLSVTIPVVSIAKRVKRGQKAEPPATCKINKKYCVLIERFSGRLLEKFSHGRET